MLYFSMICGWVRSKSNLGNAAGTEITVKFGNEKLHVAKARSLFLIKICFLLYVRTTF